MFIFFLHQNPQQNQLCELLNSYTKHGVPKTKSSFYHTEYSDEAMNALNEMPSSWRDFVKVTDILEIDTKIQSAIWELVTTEVDYIHAIQTVTDVSYIRFHSTSKIDNKIAITKVVCFKTQKTHHETHVSMNEKKI